MNASPTPESVGLVRVDRGAGEPPGEICTGRGLGPDGIFVITDALPTVGARETLRIEAPGGLVAATVEAIVTQVSMGTTPGAPAGFSCRFCHATSATRAALADVVDALTGATDRCAGRELAVLHVEPFPLLRDTFAYTLRKYFEQRAARVEIRAAANGDDALLALDAAGADVAVVDLATDAADGAGLVKRIRRSPHRGMFVVATGKPDPRARAAALAAGADLYVDKPLALRELFRTLCVVLSTGGRRAPAA